jgi:RNA recognition motif-containing protein
MRLYVGNLSFNTGEPELEQLFASVGQVVSVRLVRDRATGQSRGFGFVERTDAAQGQAACEALNEREFEGRRLTVNEARPQERSGGGGGGFGGDRGGQRRERRW